jgi:hypothetical protein
MNDAAFASVVIPMEALANGKYLWSSSRVNWQAPAIFAQMGSHPEEITPPIIDLEASIAPEGSIVKSSVSCRNLL